MWSHRLFYCQKRKGTFLCRIQLKDVNHWLPRSFLWTLPDEPDTLRAYIDALHEKNKTVSSLWEGKGAAVDHVYESAPEGAIIRLDPFKLMAILRGEYVLDVPCTGRLVLVEDNQRKTYMPQDIQVSLLAADGPLADLYLKTLRDRQAAGLPLLCMTEKEFESPTVKAHHIEVWNPKMNLDKTLRLIAPVQPSQETAATPEVDKETEISRVEHETYREVNYTCAGYFVRRLFRDEKPFWAGSSYDTKQWSIFFIDQPIFDAIFQPEMSV